MPETSTAAPDPLVIVGFAPEWPDWIARAAPGRPAVFIEEPDVARKRGAHEALAAAKHCTLLEVEYQLPESFEKSLAACPDLRPAAVVPGHEYAVPFAARLAAHHGLPGAGVAAAEALRDKALLRTVTAAHGVPNPASRQAGSEADLARFAAEYGYPLIAKPADRQGSLGMRIAREPADLAATWADALVQEEGDFVPDRPRTPRILVEQFVEGPGFNVIMLVAQGRPAFATVAVKGLFPGARPVEHWHLLPADVPAGVWDALIEATAQVVEAVGMDAGVVGCEWILPEDGSPRLVECCGRLVGDLLISMAELAYGLDIPGALLEILTTGRAPAALPAAPTRHCSVQFLTGPAGAVLADADAYAPYESAGVLLADVLLEPGDTVPELRSAMNRIGLVLAEAADGPTARARAEAAATALAETFVYET
jgi:biotin carboxylase